MRDLSPKIAATALIFSLSTTGFATTPLARSETMVQPRIEVGASFLLKQEFTKQGQKESATWPRFDAFARNQAGGLLMAADHGPKKTVPGNVILSVRYALPPDGCAVDLFDGIAVLRGEQCKQPLSSLGEWLITTPEKLSETCQVVRPEAQQFTVPAGAYKTIEIGCRTAPNPGEPTYTANYWYAAEIGAMVRVMRRKIDPTGTELVLLIEELQTYEPAPARKPSQH
jgi:hypothetical protein